MSRAHGGFRFNFGQIWAETGRLRVDTCLGAFGMFYRPYLPKAWTDADIDEDGAQTLVAVIGALDEFEHFPFARIEIVADGAGQLFAGGPQNGAEADMGFEAAPLTAFAERAIFRHLGMAEFGGEAMGAAIDLAINEDAQAHAVAQGEAPAGAVDFDGGWRLSGTVGKARSAPFLSFGA